MKDQHHQTQGQKKPYKKPQLIQVPLRPEEAVLGSCKSSSGTTAGPASSTCHSPSSCYSQAS